MKYAMLIYRNGAWFIHEIESIDHVNKTVSEGTIIKTSHSHKHMIRFPSSLNLLVQKNGDHAIHIYDTKEELLRNHFDLLLKG